MWLKNSPEKGGKIRTEERCLIQIGFLAWFTTWLHKQLYKHKGGSAGKKWVRSGRREAI